MIKIKMKAGTYYIGDNCYVLDERYLEDFDWVDDFCNYIDEGLVKVNGLDVVTFGTMYGDGIYQSNVGFNFSVDAGIIGCTPAELWKGVNEPFGCLKVNFKEDFTCQEDEGILRFGHIMIDTVGEDDEEDWQ